MNVATVILVGIVASDPKLVHGYTDRCTFQIEVASDGTRNRPIISTYNIFCLEKRSDFALSTIFKGARLFIEGDLRGQALTRKKLRNQTLIIIYPRVIRILRSDEIGSSL